MGIIQEIEAREAYYEKRIAQLEQEAKYWKDRYWQSVHDAIKHSEQMSANFVRAALMSTQTDRPR